jgi:uncharacterized protein (UPF0276 family)
VYDAADYVEYGGFFPPRNDPTIRAYLDRHPGKKISRHLVTTELPSELDISAEARAIRADLDGVDVSYLVTDFCFWRLGGRSLDNLWFRPLLLTRAVANRIAHNARCLQDELGLPLYVENPPYVYVPGDIDMANFLYLLAELGAHVCLDVGHFICWCSNGACDIDESFARLPLQAIRSCHVAGLSRVEYCKVPLWIDNHNVVPTDNVFSLLARLTEAGAAITHITYEAELASTEVQIAGLKRLGREVA